MVRIWLFFRIPLLQDLNTGYIWYRVSLKDFRVWSIISWPVTNQELVMGSSKTILGVQLNPLILLFSFKINVFVLLYI